MSLLTYNGLHVLLMKTISFEMANERDQLSGVDVTWNKYTVRVSGLVNTSQSLSTPSRTILATVKHMLETPRKPLNYSISGTTLLSSDGVDAQFGPEPLPAVCRQITEDTIFVECGYIVRQVDCGDNSRLDPVVSLRWSQTESYDENWSTVLHTTGRLVVRSDLLQSADSFRNLATPPVLRDFVRVRSKYTLAPTGSELDFEFEDQERDRLPPFPATKASGRFTVSIANGAKRRGQADVTLTGQKGTSRKDLMIVALKMAFSKLQAEGVTFTSGGDFTEDLFEPTVTVRLQGMLPSGAGVISSIVGGLVNVALAAGGVKPGAAPPAVFPSVGKEPFGVADDKLGIAPPIRKRVIALLAAAFRDPCAAAAIPQEAELKTEPRKSTAELRSNGGVAPTGVKGFSLNVAPLPTIAPVIVDSAPYEHYHIESTYYHETGAKQLPGTGVGTSGHIASFVQVHGGYMRLIVQWGAARVGSAPVLPSFLSTDNNAILEKSAITFEGTTVAADGMNQVHAAGGYAEYGIVNPRAASVAAAVPPFLADVIGQLAGETAAYLSDAVLWKFRGQTNPFYSTSNGTPPTQPTLAAIDSGGGSQSNSQPPGGLDSGDSGGSLLGQPPVNP